MSSPPIVSFKYTKTVAGKTFNNRKAVDELNVDKETVNMTYTCSSSN